MNIWILAAVTALVLIGVMPKGDASSEPKIGASNQNVDPSSSQSDQIPPSMLTAIRDNNTGVALMDLHRFQEAIGKFQTACILLPSSDTACLNAGIALLNMRQYAEARKLLTVATSHEPQNPRIWYNLGLLERASGEPARALEDFQKVAALDPDDPVTQCFIGMIFADMQQYDRAQISFLNALRLDPSNAAAEEKIAEVDAKTGNQPEAAAHRARSQELVKSGLGRTLGDSYGTHGKYGMAEELPPPDIAPPAIPIHFADVTTSSGLIPQFAEAGTSKAGEGRGPHSHQPQTLEKQPPAIHTFADFLGSGACIFDYDGDGRPDIFLVDADGHGNTALFRNQGSGKFVDVTKAAKLTFHGAGMGCAVGDYDGDGLPDLAVSASGGVRLYHNLGKGVFADVTDASGIKASGLVLGMTFADYDRNGHLDLYISRSGDFPLDKPGQPFVFPDDHAPGNMLWQNNENGTFSNATAELGLQGDSSSSGAIATDLRNTGVLDFVTTNWSRLPDVLMNPRVGAFRATTPWPTDTPGPTAGAVALDFDKDGWMDLAFSQWTPPGVSLWHNSSGKSFTRVPLGGPGWMRAWGIAPLDYGKDGWIDLVTVGETFSDEGRVALLRNEGSKGFRDVSIETGLASILLHDPRSVVPFDPIGDGSLYLLVTQNHRPAVLLKAIGTAKTHWNEIAVRGNSTNETGFGTPVELFSGALRQKWEIPAASGYLSQGPPLISAGLGENTRPDALRVFWSEGVQALLGVNGNQRLTIPQRATSDP